MALHWRLAHKTSVQRPGFSINVSVQEASWCQRNCRAKRNQDKEQDRVSLILAPESVLLQIVQFLVSLLVSRLKVNNRNYSAERCEHDSTLVLVSL